MSKFNNMNDDKLQTFLKQNQPQAPQAEASELNALMRKLKIENSAEESSSNSVWLWLATGLAASLFMFQFLTNTPAITPTQPVATPVAETQPVLEQTAEAAPKIAATAVNEEDDEFSEESVPTLDIGEEYLTLAGF